MLIISPFSDYYDGIASSGVDTTIRYYRQTSTIQATSPFGINHLPSSLMGQPFDFIGEHRYSRNAFEASIHAASCRFEVIGFCGVYIVATRIAKKYYFGENILELDWSNQKRRYKPSARQIVTDLIQKFHGQNDNSLFQQFQVPVFMVPLDSYIYIFKQPDPEPRPATFTLNPNLKDVEFYKHKDAYSSFQEIQSYISGVLGVTSQETIELSDRSKILKAGFDPKTSFRKGKQSPK